tara:strand:- start:1256 stop:1726 length:471 start_codon:yes stop_codon:yes gene_type:complete
MPYVGTQPLSGNFIKLDSISVVNNQAAYTLQSGGADFKPGQAERLLCSVNGVVQNPNDAFTVSGATITFSENLVTGDVIDFIMALGEVGTVTTPANGTVDIDKMSSSIMKNNAIRVNDTSLTSNVTIAADENAMVAGPFSIGSSVTLTVNGTFTVV